MYCCLVVFDPISLRWIEPLWRILDSTFSTAEESNRMMENRELPTLLEVHRRQVVYDVAIRSALGSQNGRAQDGSEATTGAKRLEGRFHDKSWVLLER